MTNEQRIEQAATRIAEEFKDALLCWAEVQSLKEIIVSEFSALLIVAQNDEIELLKKQNEVLLAQLAAVERDFNDYSKSVNGMI